MEGTQTCSNQETLTYEQVEKLNKAYKTSCEIHGRGNFPTLEISMQQLIDDVQYQLAVNNIPVRDVRLNGGFAGYVVGDATSNHLIYNDIDIIFSVSLDSEEALLKIKDLVVQCLLRYLPDSTNKERLSLAALTDAYVSKLTKVWVPSGDKWSLITLSNNLGMNMELKFVDTMKRKFQFSVDSFQIILDSLVRFYALSAEPMSKDFYPSVIAESMFGNFKEAQYHLNNKLIATHSPQEIRGGGLLKYCDLLSRGYVPAYGPAEVEKLEQLMCSRFFIDYSDVSAQCQKLNAYLYNHFNVDFLAMLPYLGHLYRVVNESTVCLMGHERRQALDLIHQTAIQVQYELELQQAELIYSMSTCCDDQNSEGTVGASYYTIHPLQHMHLYPGYSNIQHVY